MKLPTYTAEGRLPGVSGDVRGDPGAAAATGQGLYRAGKAVTEAAGDVMAFEAAQTKARQVADLARLQANAAGGLSELEFKLDRDPDYRSAAAKFETEAKAMRQQLAESTTDPVVRRMFETSFDKLAVAKRISVKQAAFKREADANVAQLDEQSEVYSHAIANAGSPLVRTHLLSQATGAIRGMVAAGWITEVDGGKRERGLHAKIDEADARRLITADPDGAMTAVASPQQFPNLPEDRRAVLVDMATRRSLEQARMVEIAENRKIRLDEQAKRIKSEDAQKDWMARIAKDDPTVKAQDIMVDERMNSSDRWQTRQILEQWQKPEPPAQVSRATLRSLMQRIHAPEGDPRRFGDLTEINEAFYEGSLTRADFDFARKEFADSRTGDGARLGQTKQAFLKGVEKAITRANPLAGQMDPLGDQEFYRFGHYVEQQIAKYRQEGKDPHDLFNPGKADYLGKPEVLTPYQRTLQESLEYITRRDAGRGASTSAAARAR